MYEKLYSSRKKADYFGLGPRALVYHKGLDIFLLWSWQKFARVFRDGSCFSEACNWGLRLISRVGGYPAWIGSKIYAAFDINGYPNYNKILNDGWNIPSGTYNFWYGGTAWFIDDFRAIYLVTDYQKLRMYERGIKIAELTHNEGYLHSLSWAGDGLVVGVNHSTGRVLFFYYLGGSLKLLERGRVEPCMVSAYDCEHQNIVTITSDGVVHVYAKEALPVSLSAPVFKPTAVYGYKANLVRTRLTGQDGEPCPGWWVHWELEGVNNAPVIGSLDKPVSQTDKDGYAENLFLGPDDNATGQVKLVVKVVC